jgi:hypothetical protein
VDGRDIKGVGEWFFIGEDFLAVETKTSNWFAIIRVKDGTRLLNFDLTNFKFLN